jgi:hypothetical protein
MIPGTVAGTNLRKLSTVIDAVNPFKRMCGCKSAPFYPTIKLSGTILKKDVK